MRKFYGGPLFLREALKTTRQNLCAIYSGSEQYDRLIQWNKDVLNESK